MSRPMNKPERIKGYKLKSCPCGNKKVYLMGQPWKGENDIYTYYIKCDNPKCHWTFNFTDTEWTFNFTDTEYALGGYLKSSKEAQQNVVNAWNNRKLEYNE
jgi:hypothetical protein